MTGWYEWASWGRENWIVTYEARIIVLLAEVGSCADGLPVRGVTIPEWWSLVQVQLRHSAKRSEVQDEG